MFLPKNIAFNGGVKTVGFRILTNVLLDNWLLLKISSEQIFTNKSFTNKFLNILSLLEMLNDILCNVFVLELLIDDKIPLLTNSDISKFFHLIQGKWT